MTNAVLFDVDGTLIDAIAGQRRIWGQWAREFGLDPVAVYEIALRTRPIDTAAEVLPHHDPRAAAARFDELEDLDAAIVDNAATLRGKPAPDPYLRGAELLGADPGDCLVIEDSPAGVAAGVAAGMTVWCVNRADPVPGAERWYPTLRDATSDILAFAAG